MSSGYPEARRASSVARRASGAPPLSWRDRFLLLVPCVALALVMTGEAYSAPLARHSALGVPRATPPARRVLRVCADPNNLPFSNAKGEGFENKLAALLAREMGATLEYTWWAQRRGFFRNTINAGACDLVPGVPARLEMVLATRPYYRSSYVFVQRRDARRRITSLDDPALRQLKVGVQFVGDDYANTPPAHALAARGIVRNVVGFSVYGDYSQPNPPARIIDAVADGTVDVALVWGPLAGYFARRARVPMTVVPITPQVDARSLPLAFDVSMGVRRGDAALRDEVDAVLRRRHDAVTAILDEYGVPRVPRPAGGAPAADGGRT
jgi:quinoprotein dehydrogenase-associated probable ABC transporter substrate-binding protein